MLERGRKAAEPIAWVAVICAALLAIFPRGFPNYDTIYYLLWGRELAQGMSPDYGAPLAPTPHPLYDFLGLVLAPLGNGAITATMAIAYLSLGLTAWLVYRLGSEWLNRSVGVAAAAVVMTSAPFLSNGLRAYIDLPYIALVLGALLIETRRPRAGAPVLTLLALAGLLRPEAWLFAGAYLIYLAWPGQQDEQTPGPLVWVADLVRRLARMPLLVALAAAGPVIWVVFDWATTGNPLYSLTGTRETVETLERASGPVDVILYGPRRLGEVLQWPGMVGALIGVALCFLGLRGNGDERRERGGGRADDGGGGSGGSGGGRPRAGRAAAPLERHRRSLLLGFAAAAAALAAFALLGAAGLAIIPRYTMLAAAILAVFIGAALFGWLALEPGSRMRRPWQILAVALAAFYLAWIPNQLDLLGNVDRDLANQGLVERDLEALVDSGAFEPLGAERADTVEHCLPISAPNHRAVPRLAFWLDIRPSDIVSEDIRPGAGGQGAGEAPRRDGASGVTGPDGATSRPGWFLAPAREFTIQHFILDPGDPIRETSQPPPDFELVAENRSWRLYRNCP